MNERQDEHRYTLNEIVSIETADRGTIAFKTIYADIAGDALGGLLLSQILYWYTPSKNGTSRLRVKKDGKMWIARRMSDWWDECRLTEKQARRIIDTLGNKGLIETRTFKFAGTPTTHIRLTDGFTAAYNAEMDKIAEASINENEGIEEPDEDGANQLALQGKSICPTGQINLPYRANPYTETTIRDYPTVNTPEKTPENTEMPDTANAEDASLLSTKVKGVTAHPPISIQEEEESNALSLKENRHTKPITENGIVIRKTRGNETQSTQRAASQPLPPAIAAYRAEIHRYPPKSWYDDISQTVGEAADSLARWKEILHHWVGRGWNPTNITGMLEAYKGNISGAPPGARRTEGKEEKVQEKKQFQWSSALLE